jgi:hypothetical protein
LKYDNLSNSMLNKMDFLSLKDINPKYLNVIKDESIKIL